MIVAIFTAWWFLSAGDRENNRHINRAVFPAFRTIEDACLAEQFPYESARCLRALAVMDRCLGDQERGCGAIEYYEGLYRAGFDLPPLYEAGYRPK